MKTKIIVFEYFLYEFFITKFYWQNVKRKENGLKVRIRESTYHSRGLSWNVFVRKVC